VRVTPHKLLAKYQTEVIAVQRITPDVTNELTFWIIGRHEQ